MYCYGITDCKKIAFGDDLLAIFSGICYILSYTIKKRLMDLILKAQKADEAKLALLREKILDMVSKAGAKYFVNSTAEVLKNNFQIEGCDDARIPLKRIFNIPLDELDEKLSSHKYNLPEGHPIRVLSDDHKESLGRLKELRFSLGGVNLNKESPSERIHDILEKTGDYYKELDSHTEGLRWYSFLSQLFWQRRERRIEPEV